jgi:hypothetical protein
MERWISSSLNFVFMLSFAVCCTLLLMSEYRYSQSSRWSLSKCSSLDGIANDSKLNNNQSDLQFGFTRGLSPIMAALIVSEVILQAKQQKSNLYLVTLDSQKAFDVVHHMLLLEKLYYMYRLIDCL